VRGRLTDGPLQSVATADRTFPFQRSGSLRQVKRLKMLIFTSNFAGDLRQILTPVLRHSAGVSRARVRWTALRVNARRKR
jgi:hypothetical protein